MAGTHLEPAGVVVRVRHEVDLLGGRRKGRKAHQGKHNRKGHARN
jgi:hypothetical protein